MADTRAQRDRRDAAAEVLCMMTFHRQRRLEWSYFTRIAQALAKTVHSAVAFAMIGATTASTCDLGAGWLLAVAR